MIYGENLRSSTPTQSDLPQFVTWLNDPEVRAGLLTHLPLSLEEEENWFENMLQKPAAEHPMVIEVRQGEDWKAIGNRDPPDRLAVPLGRSRHIHRR